MFNSIYKKISTVFSNYPAYIKRYIWPLPKFRKEIVVMIDGKLPHGGLTDRFRNILSIYSYCKSNNIPFKVYYHYPCDLESILEPNEYDWRIKSSRLSHHFLDSKELVLYVNPYNLPDAEFKRKNNEEHLKLLNDEFSKKRNIQYHLYGNAFFAAGHYCELYKELFKPSPYLKKRIEHVLINMQEPYEAITLRFQQLLGDFSEGNFEILPEKERTELLKECISKIEDLYSNGYFSTNSILVTSDSPTFIEEVKKLSFVYTIPGKMEHMDFTKNPDLEMNAKAFVDLYLLMNAKRITLLKIGKMYKSGFPAFAAELGNVLFNEIII